MKRVLILLVLGLQFSAFAATGRASRGNLGVMGGLATTQGDYGGNFLVGVNFLVDSGSDLRLGLESGIFFGSGTGLPIFVNFKFPFHTASKVSSYVTASVGPVLGIGDPSGLGSGNVFDSGPTGDGVRLAILLRPGMHFQVADALDLTTEIMIGGMTGFFYVGPNLGVSVNF